MEDTASPGNTSKQYRVPHSSYFECGTDDLLAAAGIGFIFGAFAAFSIVAFRKKRTL